MDFAPEEQRVYRLMKLKGLAPAEPPICFGENQDGVFNECPTGDSSGVRFTSLFKFYKQVAPPEHYVATICGLFC